MLCGLPSVRRGSHLEDSRSRHFAPHANGGAKRSGRRFEPEHLYQRDITNAAALAEEMAALPLALKDVR